MSIRYFDMFAGIGGFRSGLDAVGGFKCVGYCEIDKYAKRAYETFKALLDNILNDEKDTFAILFEDKDGGYHIGMLRKLTPKECLRLQGFSDEQIEKLISEFLDSRLYKMAGNAVSVPVISALGRKILEAYKKNKERKML